MSKNVNTEVLAKLTFMLEMQDKLNSVVNPNWKQADNDWNWAAAEEGVELMGHYGWKWWKAQITDVPQCKLELVDIFHFLLSKLILSETPMDVYQRVHFDGLIGKVHMKQTEPKAIRKQIKAMVHAATVPTDDMSYIGDMFSCFAALCHTFELTFDEIFVLYVQKNVLNTFRQKNGYKQGTYIKNWKDGREDNEHLTEISSTIDFLSPTALEDINSQLTSRYTETVAAQAQ